jgi:hypothetical protein
VILPDKTVRLRNSGLGIGAILLTSIKGRETVSSLWEKVRAQPQISSFDTFVLGLDMLFLVGLVRLENAVIVRA